VNGQGILGSWFVASASGSKTSMNSTASKAW
jgi:hypothetical protein